MPDNLEAIAVAAALRCDWKTAADINAKILKERPEDLDALNRIGKAYLELGDAKKATTYFKRVLKISRFDPIATKNLARATAGGNKKPSSNNHFNSQDVASPVSFLDEPGISKIINLVNIAPTKVLLSINCADKALITVKRHTVMATTADGTYLGAIPDDIGHRLLVLIKGGNTYDAFIKTISKGGISIFVKELSRSKKLKDTPSFPLGGADYLSFVREDLSASPDHVEHTIAPVQEANNPEDEDDLPKRLPSNYDEEEE
jgi:tetratricopeptide (TPR) repeat protein